MAKKEGNTILDYGKILSELKNDGPKNLYFLWGSENYLLRLYTDTLKKIVINGFDESFTFFSIEGPELNIQSFASTVDTFPFMGEKSFVLLKDIDLSKIKDSDLLDFLDILSNIPDYCVICFSYQPDFKPDQRLKVTRELKKLAIEIEFTVQSESTLIKWITKLASQYKKKIAKETAQRLIKACAFSMDRIKSELEKLALFSADEEICSKTVDLLSGAVDEADVFKLCECIGDGRFDKATEGLSTLLQNTDTNEIGIVAALLSGYRNIYAARLVLENKADSSIMKEVGLFGFFATNAMNTAKKLSLEAIKNSIELCLDTDYKLKSSSVNSKSELFFLMMRLCDVSR